MIVSFLAVTTIAAQIAYPLTPHTARSGLTIAVVVLFALTSLAHAAVSRGRAVALCLFLVTAVGGFAVEVLGVHTGVPFGTYRYTHTLGTQLAGVPLAIGLAWTMFAWPAALAARRIVRPYIARVIAGAWALAAWDLFLDPQMVHEGNWRWRFPTPSLPGVHTVPLTNVAGWVLVSFAMSCLLQLALRSNEPADDRWPYVLLIWTWLSSTLALGAFWGLAAAAGWGALGLGLVAVPLCRELLTHRTGWSAWRR